IALLRAGLQFEQDFLRLARSACQTKYVSERSDGVRTSPGELDPFLKLSDRVFIFSCLFITQAHAPVGHKKMRIKLTDLLQFLNSLVIAACEVRNYSRVGLHEQRDRKSTRLNSSH